MRRMLFLTGLILSIVAGVPHAHAIWLTELNQGGGTIQGKWALDKATLTPVQGGLHVQAEPGGTILLLVPAQHRVDAIRFGMVQGGPTQFLLLWHTPQDPAGQFSQMPAVTQGTENEIVSFPLSSLNAKNAWVDKVGMQFPNGADFLLLSVDFGGWSFPERVLEGVLSFFVTDSLYAYSINFLWGPLIVTNTVGREQLYKIQPPFGWSVNRFYYGILGILGIALVLWNFSQKRFGVDVSRRAIAIFFCTAGIMWLSYDLRMGGEFVINFSKDLKTYTFAETGKKEFRNVQNYNDTITRSLPVLTSVERYAAFVSNNAPIVKSIWYETYPKSRPLRGDEELSTAQAFYFFRRPDFYVDGAGRLMRRGGDKPDEVISASGSVVLGFDETSFLYVPSKQ